MAKFQTAIGKSILIKCNTHRCTLGDIKGTVIVGILFNDLGDILGVSPILAGHCYAGDNAVLQGQRVADRSFGGELPMGIEGDVLRNYFVHIQGLVICGVPAGELVTRTGGIMDGSQIVCLGISDFFGLINRHLSVVVQFAALGIKGHLAEVKKIAFSQFIIGINVRIVIIVCKQSICGGLVVFVVDGTIGVPSWTTFQTVLERSQSSREHNVFQMGAIVKGTRSNGCYIFRDGDVRQINGSARIKGMIADRLNILT